MTGYSGSIYQTKAHMIQLSTFFQWELIFVRHYVRMWFTSCIFANVASFEKPAAAFWKLDSVEVDLFFTPSRVDAASVLLDSWCTEFRMAALVAVSAVRF